LSEPKDPPSVLFDIPEEYLVEHYRNRAERLADWWVHAIGILAAIIGGALLLFWSIRYGGASLAIANALYGAGLVAMLGCSAAYNLTHIGPRRPFLRRLDEAAIFVMIAGSYTPITTQRFDGAWQIGMTTLVWAIAAFGVAGKLLFPKIPEKTWVLLYISFGWVAVLAIEPLIQGLAASALILLIVGGLVYTTGAILFLIEKLPFRRAIWHGFVVCAAAIHYVAIFTGVALADAQ